MISLQRLVVVALANCLVLIGLVLGSAVASYAQEPMVGAYYFSGAWGPGKRFWPVDEGEYGLQAGRGWDWWLGVRDFAGPSDYLTPDGDLLVIPQRTLGFNIEDFSRLEPAIGFYNDSLPRTLEKHIRQARSNGLSFFSFYWHWDEAENEELQDESISAFLRAENSDDMDFMLSIAWGNGNGLGVPPEDKDEVVELLVSKYFTEGNYLKTTDGRPMITLLSWGGVDPVDIQNAIGFIADLRSETFQVLGVYPYVLAAIDGGHAFEITNADAYTCLVDAASALFPVTENRDIDDDGDGITDRTIELRSGSQAAYNDGHIDLMQLNYFDKPFLPCYMTDFDEKPRLISKPFQTFIRQISDWTLPGFRAGVADVGAFALGPANSSTIHNAIVLYAWNEWAEEGRQLEPNASDGSLFLSHVADVLDLTTFGDSACQTEGACNASCNCSYGRDDLGFYEPVDQRFWVHPSNGTSLADRNWWIQYPLAEVENNEEMTVGDFDGDGKDDVGVYHPVDGSLSVNLSTGSTLASSVTWALDAGANTDARFAGDYDGDGATDLAVYHAVDGSVSVLLSTGSSLGLGQDWTPLNSSFPSSSISVGDFNGDLKDDLGHYSSSSNSLTVWLSDGSTFTDPGWNSALDQTPYLEEWYVGDFDGDGMDDIGVFNGLAEFWVHVSTSSSFSNASTLWTSNAGWGNNDRFVGDFNGDGIDDLSIWAPPAYPLTFWVHLSNGQAFETRTVWDDDVGWNVVHLVGNFDGQ